MAKLIVFAGSQQQREVDLSGRSRVVLGRAPQSDIVIPRRMASRSHAVIEREGARFILRDTDSYNGTLVNNRPVHQAELLHGDEIRIANQVLRFLDASATDEPLLDDTLKLPAGAVALPGDMLEVDHEDVAKAHATLPAQPAEVVGPGSTGSGPTGAPAPVSRPATAAAPPAAPRRAPAPAPAPRPLRPARVALVLLVVGLVAAAAWYYGPARHSRSAPGQPAASDEPTPDQVAFDGAASAAREGRHDLLWDFIRTYPRSRLRASAYLRLLDLGEDRVVVCDHARGNAADLLASEPALADRCGQP